MIEPHGGTLANRGLANDEIRPCELTGKAPRAERQAVTS